MLITKRSLILGGMAAAAVGFVRPYQAPKSAEPLPQANPGRPLTHDTPNFDEEDKTVTHKFIETAHHHPLVMSLRRSVGLTEIDTDTFTSKGSAVLLDYMGTLALTAHQVDSNIMNVRFLPHPDRALHYCETKAVLIAQDKRTDTSYWRLVNTGVIEAFGLKPIQWGRSGNGQHFFGETVLSMGFPDSAHGELDAATHRIEEYFPSIVEAEEDFLPNGSTHKYVKTIDCKIGMTEAIGAGSSGGGVFDDVKGHFLGTMTSGTSTDSQFTPADAIWNGYVNLVPAARQQHLALLQQEHAECDIYALPERRHLLPEIALH